MKRGFMQQAAYERATNWHKAAAGVREPFSWQPGQKQPHLFSCLMTTDIRLRVLGFRQRGAKRRVSEAQPLVSFRA
jgi:hypothetical protein